MPSRRHKTNAGLKPLGRLQVLHHEYEGGKLLDYRDLGWGYITNSSMNMQVLDYFWMGLTTPGATLGLMNYHSTGTGTTAEGAGTDYNLQTMITSGSYTGSTNGYFTGVVTAPTNGAANVYTTTGALTYNATKTVTEWGLSMSNGAAIAHTATGTPAATTFTDTGNTPFTTSGGTFGTGNVVGWCLEIGGPINTPTTTVNGIITSITSTSVANLASGWQTLANAAGTTPSASSAYCIYPTMLDRKVMSPGFGVVAGNVLTFVFQLTATSGG